MSEVEIVEPKTELIEQIKSIGLEETTERWLAGKYEPFFRKALVWEEQAKAIVVTDVNDEETMKQAGDMRKELKALRCSVERERKILKEDALKVGKAIDTIARTIKGLIEPLESHLKEQEEFAEIQRQKEIARLQKVRKSLLDEFGFDSSSMNLGEMANDVFDQMLSTAESSHEAKLKEAEAEKKRKAEEAEAERKRQEEAAAEKARLEAENARLLQEQKDREEREAAERAAREEEVARLQSERAVLVDQFEFDHSYISLGEMEEDAFQKLLEKAKTVYAEKLEADQKAAEEAERKRIEDEEYKRQQEESAAQIEAERKKSEEAQAEAKQLRDAEQKRLQEEAEQALKPTQTEAEGRLADPTNHVGSIGFSRRQATDKQKLESLAEYADEVRTQLKSDAGRECLSQVVLMIRETLGQM